MNAGTQLFSIPFKGKLSAFKNVWPGPRAEPSGNSVGGTWSSTSHWLESYTEGRQGRKHLKTKSDTLRTGLGTGNQLLTLGQYKDLLPYLKFKGRGY